MAVADGGRAEERDQKHRVEVGVECRTGLCGCRGAGDTGCTTATCNRRTRTQNAASRRSCRNSNRIGNDVHRIATNPVWQFYALRPLLFLFLRGDHGSCRVGFAGIAWVSWLFSRASVAAMTSILAVVASATPSSAVVVPLSPAGLQYAANVTVTSANYSLSTGLIVDSLVDFVAFPACGNVTETDANLSAGVETGEANDTCIPYETGNDGIRWTCRELTVDGGTVELHHEETIFVKYMTFLGDQEVSLTGSDLSAEGDVVLAFDITTPGNSGTLEGWESAEGVLGLARFPHRSCQEDETVNDSDRSVFSKMIGTDTYFALDLGDESYESTLEIGEFGGVSNGTFGNIHWGEVQTATYPSSWGFSAFDLSACGRSMMNNVTSFWPAVVSTGSACLGLPEEFFDSLMAWLPVNESCPADALADGGLCSIPAENATEELPSLSFRLSQDGQQFYIPLTSLLLDEEEGQGTSGTAAGSARRLCVTRGDPILETGGIFELPSSQPLVSLGTLPLRSLYTVVDVGVGRVGIAQKVDDASLRESGDANCLSAEVCIGMQRFEESFNTCEDPACSSYFFASLDEDTKTCKSTGLIRTVAWLFGGLFGLTEMAGHFLRVYYGATGVGLRGHRHRQGWEYRVGRLLEAGLGKVTRILGGGSPRERSD